MHAALASVQPGEVLVLTLPEPEPVAIVGRCHGGPGEGARGGWPADRRSHPGHRWSWSDLGLPVWARFVRARGAAKEEAGELRRATP